MLHLTLTTPLRASDRTRELARQFDLDLRDRLEETFSADLPPLDDSWTIGAIVGPSASGKTSIARAAFGQALCPPLPWPREHSILDAFGNHSLSHITRALCAVGFSSPPNWLKPYAILSNGEQSRADLARALLGERPLVVIDEFTSVLDRTVARTVCAALSKALRKNTVGPTAPKHFVAVTCHHDILPWLAPDWIYDLRDKTLCRTRPRRPRLTLRISRAPRSLWNRFKRHHYLSGHIHRSAQCYAGYVENRPAVFVAVLPHPHPIRPGYREHRLVTDPDYQGLGLGNAMSEHVASLYIAEGKPYFSTTAHPAMIAHRTNSPLWRQTHPARKSHPAGRTTSTTALAKSISTKRITAGFEYVGPASNTAESNKPPEKHPPSPLKLRIQVKTGSNAI